MRILRDVKDRSALDWSRCRKCQKKHDRAPTSADEMLTREEAEKEFGQRLTARLWKREQERFATFGTLATLQRSVFLEALKWRRSK
jgi:hypothetical protein